MSRNLQGGRIYDHEGLPITYTNPFQVTSGYTDTLGVTHGFINNGGQPQICNQPYLQAMSEGDITGHIPLTKNGYNPALSSTEQTIWAAGGDYVYPATAQQMEVVSSSGSDASGGTGARTVEVHYLTTDFTEKTETITLTGVTPVNTTATDIYRVNYFRVKTTGTGLANAGNIDIKAKTPLTTIYSRIGVGINRAFGLVYTVPKTKSIHIYNLLFSAGSNVANRPVRFITKANYDNISSVATTFFMPYTNVIITDGSVDVPLESPTTFPAGVDLKINAICPDGAAYGAVTLRAWIE